MEVNGYYQVSTYRWCFSNSVLGILYADVLCSNLELCRRGLKVNAGKSKVSMLNGEEGL